MLRRTLTLPDDAVEAILATLDGASGDAEGDDADFGAGQDGEDNIAELLG
jgi:hypothetical protein